MDRFEHEVLMAGRRGWVRAVSPITLAWCVSCAPADDQPLVLYEFDCGVISVASVAGFGLAEDETDVRELHVPCFILEHPNGTLLWDGGLPSEDLDRTLADQLVGTPFSLSSLDYVAFSHMHYDHVGVANEIEGATLLIQRPEYEAAFADNVTVPVFRPALYAGLRDLPRELLDGEYDVFGDGRARIIPAPGHTPGHQVLLVELAEEGLVLLAGDLYHFRASRAGRRVPAFNVDSALTASSMESIERLVQEVGAELWIEHDMARFREHQAHLPAHR